MDVRNDLVDVLASFALFADLTTPELESVVQTFDEAWFKEGERILRQGLSGSGFYVILDGTASIRVDVCAVRRGTARGGRVKSL
jgi:signal-transduction protein with cAMP-binding, CBS, and nucleotidyltransferase domain